MFDAALANDIRGGAAKARAFNAAGIVRPDDFESLERTMDAMEGGTPLDVGADSVTHHNSLQIGNALRFVYSADGNFSLAREMLSEHAEVHAGWRFAIR